MRLERRLIIAALTLVLAGCGTGLLPGDPARPAGGREWVITVTNNSNEPAILAVAEDVPNMGALVGTAQPSSVPPRTTQDVVFTVPPGDGWAIFVNPSPERGPLIISQDVPPNVSGRLPITIDIGPNGDPGAAMPGNLGPGWFGN
jgi:hypothetical protein